MKDIKETIRGNLKYVEMAGYVLLFVLAWELISGNLISTLFLPSPSVVVNYLATEFTLNGLFQTITVLALGFPIAVALGFVIGFLVTYSRTLYRSVYPILFSFKAIPSTGIAILLVVWLGTGFATKFFVVLYTGFFSVMVNTAGGLARIKYDYVEMMQSIQASKMTIFRKLLFPNALPHIFTGIKNACPDTIIGVIVAELFAGNTGLGYVFTWAASINNVPLEFAALVWMGILGMVLFGIVITIERAIRPWYLRKY